MEKIKQQLSKLDKRRLVFYSISGAIGLLIILIFSFTYRTGSDSESAPLVTTKLRASLLTYKRTITIGNATPTPVNSGGLSAGGASVTPTGVKLAQGISPSLAQSRTSATPTNALSPTLTQSVQITSSTIKTTTTPSREPTLPNGLVYDDLTPTDTTSTTDENDLDATGSITSAVSPTNTKHLPESGSIQYPSILFISASIVLFLSFLF